MTGFLAANWPWIVFLVAMLTMHRHGGCGMHSHHQHQSQDADSKHADERQTRT